MSDVILQHIKEKNDSHGAGFCILKWWHAEMHLAEGINMSCYHCPPHNLQLDQDLHNTDFKKLQRKTMLEGGKPSECSRCWDLEDKGDIASPRQILTGMLLEKDQTLDLIDETAKIDWNTNVYPKYLELSFSNRCQLKCSYCAPQKSSSWFKEMQEYGDYELSEDNRKQYSLDAGWNLYDEDTNPYIQKFWDWFPEAYNHLETLRVTGGEPFLSEHVYDLIDYVRSHPRDIEFHVNSNLMVSDRRIKKYIEASQSLNSKVYVSIDSWGQQAEWIRHGLNLKTFTKNLMKLLNAGEKIGFMVTVCLLSLPNFKRLLDIVRELQIQYPNQVSIDTPHMTAPIHLSAAIADDNIKTMATDALKYMKELGFGDIEYMKFKSCVDWIVNTQCDDIERHRKDFATFIDQHDKRRGSDWHTTFPELEYFYGVCRG